MSGVVATQPTESTQPVGPTFEWTHSTRDAVSVLSFGPWTAMIGDPMETPQAVRMAGRYLARGLLRHSSGRSLSRDFPGNTQEEATRLARKWVEGSITLWLRAVGTTSGGDLHLLTRLDADRRSQVLMAGLNSLRVSRDRGHLPPNTPIGADALQPRPQVVQPKRKGRKRRRR